LIIAVVFIASCTPYKSVPYFQDLKKDKIYKEQISNFSPMTVQPGDLLAIHFTSLNHDADAPFNYSLLTSAVAGTQLSGVDRQEQEVVTGYLVDTAGIIHLPFVGGVKVSGMTTSEISTTLEGRLSDYLSKPSINVRIANFKISVLGDVNHPGVYSSKDERLTVTDAISLAGDLNTTGIRDSVLLIREFKWTREYVPLDLKSKKIFSSPYFYLKNNDIIYVQPNKDKVAQSDSGIIKASLIISALSVLAIILTKL
jgi:polysaccharide export outer membrane protein